MDQSNHAIFGTKEVSLTDAIIYAHQYKNLSGEMATQDAAMFRLLLAITVTIFYRYDADGTSRDLREEDEWEEEESDDELDENTVLRRWKRYWKKGRFSEHAVREYLETWRERFWLFHPETPFWQVKDLPYGTDYGVECLLGNMKESNNKKTQHHFSMMEGEELARLSYGEVTRWLIHLNAYAVNVKTDKRSGPRIANRGGEAWPAWFDHGKWGKSVRDSDAEFMCSEYR